MTLFMFPHAPRTAAFIALPAFALFAVASPPAAADSTSTTLSATPSPSLFGETVTFSATVYGSVPTGTVKLKDDGDTIATETPDTVGAGAAITAGYEHTCTVSAEGAAQCWGRNFVGQLGDGSDDDSPVPVQVDGLTSDVISVGAGSEFTCALLISGNVKCWGDNGAGQLGRWVLNESNTPVKVRGINGNAVGIALGGAHACTVTDDGAAKCWGQNDEGQLGNGKLSNNRTTRATQVIGLESGVVQVVAGDNHTCALTDAGAVKCWGENQYGQLGDGSGSDSASPVDVSGLSSGIAYIGAGLRHTCAIDEDGAMMCWGINDWGQTGNGDTDSPVTTPVDASVLTTTVTSVAGGTDHTCVVTTAGGVQCWGKNGDGQLGNGTNDASATPVDVTDLTSDAANIALGDDHSCAQKQDGSAVCWGRNTLGELGNGNDEDSNVPVDVEGYGTYSILAPGKAVFSVSDLSKGRHRMKAKYSGDDNNDASTSSELSHRVKKGETKIKSIKVDPDPPQVGEPATVEVAVAAVSPASGTPTGQVVLKYDGDRLGKFRLDGGKISIETDDLTLTVGDHELQAIYKGVRNWEKSKGSTIVTVE